MTERRDRFPGRPLCSGADNPRNLLTSLVLVFPLFLIYQVGVLFTLPHVEWADFRYDSPHRIFRADEDGLPGLPRRRPGPILVTLAVLGRRQRFQPLSGGPVILESVVWALTMGSLIVFVMTKVLGIEPDWQAE